MKISPAKKVMSLRCMIFEHLSCVWGIFCSCGDGMSCVLGTISEVPLNKVFGREECDDAKGMGNPFSGFGGQ